MLHIYPLNALKTSADEGKVIVNDLSDEIFFQAESLHFSQIVRLIFDPGNSLILIDPQI